MSDENSYPPFLSSQQRKRKRISFSKNLTLQEVYSDGTTRIFEEKINDEVSGENSSLVSMTIDDSYSIFNKTVYDSNAMEISMALSPSPANSPVSLPSSQISVEPSPPNSQILSVTSPISSQQEPEAQPEYEHSLISSQPVPEPEPQPEQELEHTLLSHQLEPEPELERTLISAQPEPEPESEPEPQPVSHSLTQAESIHDSQSEPKPEPELSLRASPSLVAEPEPELSLRASPSLVVEPEPELSLLASAPLVAEPEPTVGLLPELWPEQQLKPELSSMSGFQSETKAEPMDTQPVAAVSLPTAPLISQPEPEPLAQPELHSLSHSRTQVAAESSFLMSQTMPELSFESSMSSTLKHEPSEAEIQQEIQESEPGQPGIEKQEVQQLNLSMTLPLDRSMFDSPLSLTSIKIPASPSRSTSPMDSPSISPSVLPSMREEQQHEEMYSNFCDSILVYIDHKSDLELSSEDLSADQSITLHQNTTFVNELLNEVEEDEEEQESVDNLMCFINNRSSSPDKKMINLESLDPKFWPSIVEITHDYADLQFVNGNFEVFIKMILLDEKTLDIKIEDIVFQSNIEAKITAKGWSQISKKCYYLWEKPRDDKIITIIKRTVKARFELLKQRIETLTSLNEIIGELRKMFIRIEALSVELSLLCLRRSYKILSADITCFEIAFELMGLRDTLWLVLSLDLTNYPDGQVKTKYVIHKDDIKFYPYHLLSKAVKDIKPGKANYLQSLEKATNTQLCDYKLTHTSKPIRYSIHSRHLM